MASRSDIQKAYIERKKQAMGEDKYNEMMRLKKAQYRARVKPRENVEVGAEKTESKIIHNHLDALDKLKEIFTKLNTKSEKPLRPTTIDNYIQKINRIAILMTGQGYTGDNSFLNDASKVSEAINTSDLKSKKDYITPITRLLRHLNVPSATIEEYQKKMKSFKEEEYSTRKDNLANSNELQNYIPLEDIRKKFDEYKPKDDMELIYKLIVSLYFMGDKDSLVPRNNLPDMKIVSSSKKKKDMNPEWNYVVIDKELNPLGVIMNRYKTQHTYGRQSFTFSPIQKQLMKQYLKSYGKKAGDWLFVDKAGNPFKYSNFNDLILTSMEKVLGKPINIDLVRKILITDYYKQGVHSINEDEAFHHKFLHSVSVGKEYLKTNFKDEE
jgi:hypothetical protein